VCVCVCVLFERDASLYDDVDGGSLRICVYVSVCVCVCVCLSLSLWVYDVRA